MGKNVRHGKGCYFYTLLWNPCLINGTVSRGWVPIFETEQAGSWASVAFSKAG